MISRIIFRQGGNGFCKPLRLNPQGSGRGSGQLEDADMMKFLSSVDSVASLDFYVEGRSKIFKQQNSRTERCCNMLKH